MRLFLRYLRGRRGVIALFLTFALIFAAVFRLYHLPIKATLYPAGLCFAVGLCYMAVDFLRVKKHHALIQTELPEAHDIESEDYQNIIHKLRDEKRDDQARAQADFQAMTDYYTLWAHQIKTPIAAMRLKLQGQDTAEARGLLNDLSRVERYVGMALTYLRLEGDGTDYVIRECDLDALLRSAIRPFSGEFILRKLKLDYQPVDVRVLTDAKWLGFVVEQILSNALKYTPEGTISVYLEEPCTLCIRDTGIGIVPEDLPRVFEQSYTGLTGRESRQASGIGLYLCKRICDALGHGISIQSAVGEGTTVCIDVSRREVPVE